MVYERSGATSAPTPAAAPPMALSTAPIFDEAVYLCDALCLPDHQSEDELETGLASFAQQIGIHDPHRFLTPTQPVGRALSTCTLDSDHRSSISVHSHETQATSLTSAHSRTSRDHSSVADPCPAQRGPLQLALPLLPLLHADHGDRALPVRAAGRPQRHSTSAVVSIPLHALSCSPPSPHTHTRRRRRGSALFAMFRKDSTYPLPPPPFPPTVTLTQTGSPATPSPRPVSPVPSSADSVMHSVLPLPDMDLLAGLECARIPLSPIQLTLSLDSSTSEKSGPSAEDEPTSLELPLAYKAFESFRAQQKEQFSRVSAFECRQRSALTAHHQSCLNQLAADFKRNRHERGERHAKELDQLEDSQLTAEHDLRQAHNLERQNVATALKHMEAYCLGTNVFHPEHAHVVSEEEFQTLDRQRLIQQDLPRKLQSAINVLRARQERDTKRKLQKQEDELDAMHQTHRKQKAAREVEHRQEMERLESIIHKRRTRLLRRWDLKLEIWRHEWEEQHSTTLDAKFEHESWPCSKMQTTPSSLRFDSLAHFAEAAA